MRTRNGFVSNSSSSSFLLTYDSRKILETPEDILEILRKSPDSRVIIRGTELSDGEDCFELDSEQKSLIRRFPQEFIRTNSGTEFRSRYVFEKDGTCREESYELSKIRGYLDADLQNIDREMWDSWTDSRDESGEDSESYRKKVVDRISCRVKDSMKALGEIGPEDEKNIVSEEIYVDYDNSNGDMSSPSEFAERYLTYEDPEEYASIFHTGKFSRMKEHPYAILYSDFTQDRKKIVEEIEALSSRGYTGDTLAIARYNKVFSDTLDISSLDLYTIGEDEGRMILDDRDSILEGQYEYLLLRNPVVVERSLDSTPQGMRMSVGYGRLYMSGAGENIPDFCKVIMHRNHKGGR